jgi:hypothetical protein
MPRTVQRQRGQALVDNNQPAFRSDGPRWVRNKVLAEYLNVSEVTIWNWRHDAGLNFPAPSIIRGLPYTDLDAVDAWMRSRVADRTRAVG